MWDESEGELHLQCGHRGHVRLPRCSMQRQWGNGYHWFAEGEPSVDPRASPHRVQQPTRVQRAGGDLGGHASKSRMCEPSCSVLARRRKSHGHALRGYWLDFGRLLRVETHLVAPADPPEHRYRRHNNAGSVRTWSWSGRASERRSVGHTCALLPGVTHQRRGSPRRSPRTDHRHAAEQARLRLNRASPLRQHRCQRTDTEKSPATHLVASRIPIPTASQPPVKVKIAASWFRSAQDLRDEGEVASRRCTGTDVYSCGLQRPH